MRTLAIGDIHGCLTALTTLLDFVAPAPDDRLITLGDYVDRGPDSRGVLDLLIALHTKGQVVALRGNHEEMMVSSRTSEAMRRMWLGCGGRETLASYGAPEPDAASLDAVPPAHWRFLEETCVDWFVTERHFFVHANAYPDVPFDEQPGFMLRWEGVFEPIRHFSGKVMICGHTRQPDGLPLNLGSTVCIDTGAYDREGWLTCLDVDAGRYWQADQHGRCRQGVLTEADS
jgi:serine/threonine protein phosphatase 1